jgi:RNA polymerase sigma factor (sigma-70 family)
VRAIAAGYRNYGLPLDDLVQEGSVGLLEAIDHYDPARGPAFGTYARFRIRRAIRNALTEQARTIRLPKHIVERRSALDRAEARLVAAGKRPTPSELAAVTGLSVTAVLEARTATQATVSLDEPVLPDGSALNGIVADPAASDPASEAVEHEQSLLIEQAVAQLPPRQRDVVTAQWGLGGAPVRSATELAAELGLSPRRTQAIGQRGLYQLRKALEPDGRPTG